MKEKFYIQNEIVVNRLPDDFPAVIVTRHAGLVEWLRRHGVEGEVVPHATEENVRGKIVYGALPFHLAALAAGVMVVDMPHLLPEQRGKDLSADEMDAAGANLTQYCVVRMTYFLSDFLDGRQA